MAQSADQLISPAANQPPARSPLTVSEQLLHSTVLLQTVNNKNERSTGTGFIFLLFNHENTSVPIIVTNKHVIAGAVSGSFILTRATPDGFPDFGNNISVSLTDFEKRWISHPDDNVDLSILPIASMLSELKSGGNVPFYIGIDPNLIPTDEAAQLLTPLEDVLVVGYPDGISDTINNIPVFRRGITATPFYLNFNGTKQFLIDASIFPGSSGSPVFLFNQGTWANRSGGASMGTRVQLLGIVYGVATHTTAGEIRLVPAPTQMRPVAISAIPNNIGACIKSSRILEFEPVIVELGFKPPEGYEMRAHRQ